MIDDECPKCGLGPLEDGEILQGDRAFRWRYCDECRWRGEITLFRVMHYSWGTTYKIDTTIVLPALALKGMMKGRLQLSVEDPDNSPAGQPSLSSSGPSAPCPHCGAVIRQRYQPCEDLSGYMVFWSCEKCDYKGEAMKIPAPALFTPLSEGYRLISWKCKPYHLTRNQILIIRRLHQAYLAGEPDVHQNDLLKEIGQSSRVKDSFRKVNNELWGTLIIHAPNAPRGTSRLNL